MDLQVVDQAGVVVAVVAVDGEEDTMTTIMILHRHTTLRTQVNLVMVPVRDGDQVSGPEPQAGPLRVGLLDGWVTIRRALAGAIVVGVAGATVRVVLDPRLGIASPTRGMRALVLDPHPGDETFGYLYICYLLAKNDNLLTKMLV